MTIETPPVDPGDPVAMLKAQVAALEAQVNKPSTTVAASKAAGTFLVKWHPVIVGAAVAIAPPLLNYFGTVPWQTLGISPAASMVIGAVIVALRTTTLAGVK